MHKQELDAPRLWSWVQAPAAWSGSDGSSLTDELPDRLDPDLAAQLATASWHPCTQFPSQIHVELKAAELIPDPFRGLNERVSTSKSPPHFRNWLEQWRDCATEPARAGRLCSGSEKHAGSTRVDSTSPSRSRAELPPPRYRQPILDDSTSSLTGWTHSRRSTVRCICARHVLRREAQRAKIVKIGQSTGARSLSQTTCSVHGGKRPVRTHYV